MENQLRETVCQLAAVAPPEARRRAVEEVAARGYAGKEIAKMMGVSPAAVSRYLHGSLAPSPDSLCNLARTIDAETVEAVAAILVEHTWKTLHDALRALAATGSNRVVALLEHMADDIAELLLKAQKQVETLEQF